MGMALDIRLACLRDAILENWIALEAYENGSLKTFFDLVEKSSLFFLI